VWSSVLEAGSVRSATGTCRAHQHKLGDAFVWWPGRVRRQAQRRFSSQRVAQQEPAHGDLDGYVHATTEGLQRRRRQSSCLHGLWAGRVAIETIT